MTLSNLDIKNLRKISLANVLETLYVKFRPSFLGYLADTDTDRQTDTQTDRQPRSILTYLVILNDSILKDCMYGTMKVWFKLAG